MSTHRWSECLIAEHDDKEVNEVTCEHGCIHVGGGVVVGASELAVEVDERAEHNLQSATQHGLLGSLEWFIDLWCSYDDCVDFWNSVSMIKKKNSDQKLFWKKV